MVNKSLCAYGNEFGDARPTPSAVGDVLKRLRFYIHRAKHSTRRRDARVVERAPLMNRIKKDDKAGAWRVVFIRP